MTKRPTLRLLRGGLGIELRLGPSRVVAAPRDQPPFAVDAVVEEEDTYLVLSADPQVRPLREPLIRLMTEVREAQPVSPGSVVARHRSLLIRHAIEHSAPDCLKRIWLVVPEGEADSVGRELISLESSAANQTEVPDT